MFKDTQRFSFRKRDGIYLIGISEFRSVLRPSYIELKILRVCDCQLKLLRVYDWCNRELLHPVTLTALSPNRASGISVTANGSAFIIISMIRKLTFLSLCEQDFQLAYLFTFNILGCFFEIMHYAYMFTKCIIMYDITTLKSPTIYLHRPRGKKIITFFSIVSKIQHYIMFFF